MIVSDITKRLEEHSPKCAACEWDNVGLLVGDLSRSVSRVYVALDATDQVVAHAIDNDCQLLVTHHPLIFSGMKAVNAEDFIGRRIIAMLENQLSYYAMHTNFDVYGMGSICAERIGLLNSVPMDICSGEEGMGRIGDPKEACTLSELASLVKKEFCLPSVRVYGDLDSQVQKIAIMPGSGKSEVDLAIELGADVMITGDIDHHSGIDGLACGLNIIDAGHYGLEHVFIDYVAELIGDIDGIEVFKEEIKHPYSVI